MGIIKRFQVRRAVCLFLCLCLACVFLSACSKKKSTDSGKESAAEKVEEGELSSDSVVLTVGRESVTYAQMLVYAYILRSMYHSSFGSALWNYQISEEGTLEDYAKEELVGIVTRIKVIGLQAKKQDVILDNDEKTEIAGKAIEFFDGISEKNKKKYCLTQELVEKTFQENALATKMFYLVTEDVDSNIQDEAAKQVRIQYLQLMTDGTNSSGVKVRMNNATKKATAKRMKKLRKEAETADSFYSFASENTDSNEVEVTLGSDSEAYEKVFLDTAMSMKKGKLSPVIEGENSYYLIYCVSDFDEEATLARKEAIIAERENALFCSRYDEWLAGYEVIVSNAYWEQIHI